MSGRSFNKEPECSTCVYFDADECMCSIYNDSVDPGYVCESYEQDDEPEPVKIKNHHKKKYSEDQ